MERNEIIDVLQNLAQSWFSSSQQNAIHYDSRIYSWRKRTF